MNQGTSIKQGLLIIGAGDIAFRALPWLKDRFRVFALCRSAPQAAHWRSHGAIPVLGDLDQRKTLSRLRGLASYVVYTAPPNPHTPGDPRLKRCLAVLNEAGIIPCRVVYISTTGVYGNKDGAEVSETSPVRPDSARAQRRVAAEQLLRAWTRRQLCWGSRRSLVLRAPGIYAADRLPLERIQAKTPALLAEEDSFSHHIHAEDLAHALCLALFRGGSSRIFNVVDDSRLKMGDWFDAVARRFGLPPVPRLPRSEAEKTLSPALWSFVRESRQIQNLRLKEELMPRLRFPTVEAGLASILDPHGMIPP